ncbi:putative quinoprotein alcohol dehydrogenase-like superfamily [Dioscorea sansibarensis]
METLSDDILIEILTKLPFKSLFRLSSVSKQWQSLISDKYLKNKLPLMLSGVYHLSDSAKASSVDKPRFACFSDNGFEDMSLSFFPFNHVSSIIDCCHGLLLCYSSLNDSYYVCNPILKKWFQLPKLEKRSKLSILAFDPCHSIQYKAVCFTAWRAQGAEVEVYSSETGIWTSCLLNFGVDTDKMSATIRYFDGVLYVLALPRFVIGVNLETMSCRRIELPEKVTFDGCIGKSCGQLHYCSKNGKQINIWVMMDSSSWSLKHSFSVHSEKVRFLAFHPELGIVYLWTPGKIISYNLVDKRFDDVCEFVSEMKEAFLIQMWLYPFFTC